MNLIVIIVASMFADILKFTSQRKWNLMTKWMKLTILMKMRLIKTFVHKTTLRNKYIKQTGEKLIIPICLISKKYPKCTIS